MKKSAAIALRESRGRTVSPQEGVGVVEIMVVLVIAGIILSLALPNFVGYMRRGRVETAANDLEAHYQMARQKAVMERAFYRCLLDPDAGTYRIERRVGGTTWVGAPDETYELPNGVTMVTDLGNSASNLDLVIDPQGIIDLSDVPCTISFQGSNDTLTVRIVRTGRVRTDRGN